MCNTIQQYSIIYNRIQSICLSKLWFLWASGHQKPLVLRGPSAKLPQSFRKIVYLFLLHLVWALHFADLLEIDNKIQSLMYKLRVWGGWRSLIGYIHNRENATFAPLLRIMRTKSAPMPLKSRVSASLGHNMRAWCAQLVQKISGFAHFPHQLHAWCAHHARKTTFSYPTWLNYMQISI